MRALLGAMLLMVAAVVWLHLVHVVAGHGWFAIYGPVLGLVLAVGIVLVAVPSSPDRPVRWPRVAAAAVLLVLLVTPEWLEGELVSGHRLDADTIGDHGWSTLAVLATAATLVAALEARRILRFLER